MADSLLKRYPKRIEVPLLLLVSFIVFLIGLSMPLMKIEKMVFWKNEYSIITGVFGLMHDNQYVLAAILFFFSVVFPAVKLIALGIIWIVKMTEKHRQLALHWLGILGKWSMLDVFVVAILIVLVKLGSLAKVTPQNGVYVFAFAILLSMVTSMYIDMLAKK